MNGFETPVVRWQDTVPASVRVGHWTFKVVAVPAREAALDHMFGSVEWGDQEIRISSAVTHEHARDILLHEIIHAALYLAGAGEVVETRESVQEHACHILPGAMFLLREQNPEVWRWLFP